MSLPLAIHLGERFTIAETLALADFADEAGFDSLWVAEGRLTRDAPTIMALVAERTRNVRIGSGVINNKSRNAALTAVTFKTIDELAPGRTILGIGAWWEPLASKVGLPLNKPAASMREYIEVCRRFFANEEVTFHGEFVHMDGVRFDRMYVENQPVDIPVYTGPVGPRMLELSGEIADGVYLDFLLPTSYLHEALPAIERGRAKRETPGKPVDVVQIVACAVNDEEPEQALAACKEFLTLYLMQQPHIAAHCGVEPELVDRLKEVAGWPARPEDVRRAAELVPDSLVRSVTACGTTDQAAEALQAYLDAGVRVVSLGPLGEGKTNTIHRLAGAFA